MAKLTRSLAAGAVTALSLGAIGAVAAPATAGDGHHRGGLSLTRSAAATLDQYDVAVTWSKVGTDRSRLNGGVHRVRGSVTFDGSGTDATWSRIRINDRTNRVTAVVNGGERRAVLKFRDGRRENHRGYGDRTVFRLTNAGASSIDAAAGADAFDRGDRFAKIGHRHHHHHHH